MLHQKQHHKKKDESKSPKLEKGKEKEKMKDNKNFKDTKGVKSKGERKDETKLGKGGYGKVKERDGYAVKSFKKTSHLIQEWIVGAYLKGVKGIIKFKSFDLENKEITMELHETNLGRVIRKGELEENEKYKVFYDIVKGLAEIHGRGLVHADIRPQNILISRDPLRATIADLGFVSLPKFAKVDRTAHSYRDLDIVGSYAHDMFSLAVTMIELFGDYDVDEIKNYKMIAKLIVQTIKDENLRDLALMLANPEHNERLKASDLLFLLGKKPKRITVKRVRLEKSVPKTYSKVKKFIKEFTEKYFDVKNIGRATKVLVSFLRRHKIKEEEFKIYSLSMMLIASGIYGPHGIKENQLSAKFEVKEEDIHKTLREMLTDDELITGLLMPD